MEFDILIICLLVVASLYVGMILAFWIGFRRISRQQGFSGEKGSASILLPFCNEEHTIGATIESLLSQQTGVDYEIIAIDDHSTDKSVQIVADMAARNHRLCLIHSDEYGKKAALTTGIAVARHNIIVTTDADCIYPTNWLSAMMGIFEQSGADFLAAPMVLSPVAGWFQKFQFVDFASLVGSGIGAAGIDRPIMCNGANLMFDRRMYNKLHDPLNAKYASGDDVFLLHKMKAADAKIVFTAQSETIAATRPTPTVKAFLRQRLRWGGKTTGYTDGASICVALLVTIASAALCCGIAMIPWSVLPLCCIYIPKLMIDTLLLLAVSRRFGNCRFLGWMPVFEILAAIYTVGVALCAMVKQSTTRWKS